MKALHVDYTYLDVLVAYSIFGGTLKSHYQGKRKNRKMERRGILVEEEDETFAKYILKVVEIALALTPNQI